MKAVVGLAAVGLLACGLWWWFMAEAVSDQGIGIAHAFGDVAGGIIEIHAAVDMGMTRREEPRIDLRGRLLWDEWVTEHFSIRDESGTAVEILRIGHTPLIDERYVGGAPEFYLEAGLRRGAKYTFDYKPRRAEAKLYRHEFSAPTEPEKMQRITFELVTGK